MIVTQVGAELKKGEIISSKEGSQFQSVQKRICFARPDREPKRVVSLMYFDVALARFDELIKCISDLIGV